MVYIDETEDGLLDLVDLENKLKIYSNQAKFKNRIKIGCFTAASNITGILIDTISVTVLLHRYDVLSFWDYAAAAPYVEINMNPYANLEE
jgi:selenocysteine lyase/cysteine desulfurase